MSKWCECLKREVQSCDCPAALPPPAGGVEGLIAEARKLASDMYGGAAWLSIVTQLADALQSLSARLAEAEREREEYRVEHDMTLAAWEQQCVMLESTTARAERLEAAMREAREWLDKYLDATREGDEPAVRGGLLAKLVAALSPAPAGGDGWRDIASAPEGELVQVATPSIEESSKLWVGTARVYHADEGRFEGHLANIAHYNGAIFVTRFHARYWRPLPASPSKGGA